MASKAAALTPPASDTDWQARDDHRTLLDAEAIHQDPKRLAGVRKHNRKQLKALGKLSRSVGGSR